MVTPSNESNLHARRRLSAYGWRTFVMEFVCGLGWVIWFILMLAESIVLRGIRRLEDSGTPQLGDHGT